MMMQDNDLDALERCVQLQRGIERGHVDNMLIYRDWREVAEFCSYSLQMHSLKLKPWELPPCVGPDKGVGAALLQRMLRHGYSQYEPDLQAVILKLNKLERPQR
jgi:hypothetical protein